MLSRMKSVRASLPASLVAALLWVGLTYALGNYGAYLVPAALKPMALETFAALWQSVDTALGLALTFALVADARELLGLRGEPTAGAMLLPVLCSPGVFVLALWLGIQLAMPTLLAEFRQGGTEVSRQNLGELGQTLRQAPAILVLLWVAVIAPVAEEFVFRGALWGAFARLGKALLPARRGAHTMEDELLSTGLVRPSPLDSVIAALVAHGPPTLATLGQAAVFGLMHADVPGGAGIIRVVGALVLGLSAGLARQLSASLLPAIALHAVYNVIALGHTRGWFVSERFPKEMGVPSLLYWVAGASVPLILLALGASLLRRRRRAQAHE